MRPRLILSLDAALGACSAGLVREAALLAERRVVAGRGQAALLAPMVCEVLGEAGVSPRDLDAVAATVGPGSFTGLRAVLSLAHGVAAAIGRPVIGVTVAEAMASALPRLGRRALWTAIASRRGRVFLDHDGALSSLSLDDLPKPRGPVAVAGDASIEVAARLAATGADVMLTDARHPAPRHVAAVALERLDGHRAPLAGQPLYVDPPEAKVPAGGLRPPPV